MFVLAKLMKLELEVGGGFKLSKMEFLHVSSRTSSSTSKNIKQKQKQKQIISSHASRFSTIPILQGCFKLQKFDFSDDKCLF
jgi:hypothetical protein